MTDITLKVSEKGAISVYGLSGGPSRFPVTLYQDQMERLLAAEPIIRRFLEDNKDKLTVKK